MFPKQTVDDFYLTISAFDGFSDTEYPNLSFWDNQLNRKKIKDFSPLCLSNSPADGLYMSIRKPAELYQDVELMMETLFQEHSDLNAIRFAEYTKGDFEYQSRLVGFYVCNTMMVRYLIFPIIELSGRDAEVINSAITLLS